MLAYAALLALAWTASPTWAVTYPPPGTPGKSVPSHLLLPLLTDLLNSHLACSAELSAV